jgi:ribosome recycling factor
MYDFSKFDADIQHTIEWLTKELATVRTGRATPALLDGVKVEAYGSHMPVPQVASTSIEDARTLFVSPWDKDLVKPIERAITLADLGVSLSTGDTSIRVSFPELTGERRALLIKTTRGKLEEARVALRGERSKAIAQLEAKEKSGDLSEDDLHRAKAEVQKKIDAGNDALEALATKKEADLHS